MKRLLAASVLFLLPLACSKEPRDYRLEGPGVIYEDPETPEPKPKRPTIAPIAKAEKKKLEPAPEPPPEPKVEVKKKAKPRTPIYDRDYVGGWSGTPASGPRRR